MVRFVVSGIGLAVVIVIAVLFGLPNPNTEPEYFVGGPGALYYAGLVSDAESDIRRVRIEQELRDRREEILRYELRALEQGSGTDDQIQQARTELHQLLLDQKSAEERILQSLHQLWSIQGRALEYAQTLHGDVPSLVWPIEPRYGISAHFGDEEYRKSMGVPHMAIDIPIEQGSKIHATHDGVVVDITDNGLGFNALTLKHPSGIVTLYGHVSGFIVAEGQQVAAGDPIAVSGGLPGTRGAGWLTTGPHVHFEVMMNGQYMDPLQYLPRRKNVQ